MSGYTPVFKSVFTGTLCGRYPDTAAWLFLLALADKNGEVDMTPAYISAVTGMPVAELEDCIARFLEPDPHSRSSEADGRRLVPIDADRPWGWRIVNFKLYRERARLQAQNAAQVADGRNAEKTRRYRERKKAATPADTRQHPQDTLSDANANANADAGTLRSSSSGDLSPSSSVRANRTAQKAHENRSKLAAASAGALKCLG